VRTGQQEETIVGIDPRGQRFIDRTRSGDVAFHPDFRGRHTAPLTVESGRVRLHVFVDWSSVEIFAARPVSLESWPLRSICQQ
jgi:fructan beta-fructosidase